MTTKSKQTKAVKSEPEFNLKDFKTQVESLVQRLMTFTLRNTSLDAEVPTDRDVAEALYEQIVQGFAVLSEIDCYVGTKVNELGRYMSLLTENRHKLNAQVEVEPEPAVEENVAGSEGNKDESDDETPPVKANKAKPPTKKKQDSDEDEVPPVEEKKSSKSKSKSKKQDSDEEEDEVPPVEEKKSSKSKSKSKKQDSDEDEVPPVEEKKSSKSKSKSKKQDSDEEEEEAPPVEEKSKKSKGKKN